MSLTEIEPSLIISVYLSDKGMPYYMVKRTAGPFGKVLKDEYVKERGCQPTQVERWVGGEKRWVSNYVQADLDLFDRAWKIYQAGL